MIVLMSLTLLQHWKDSLHSCPNICAKVFRFLMLFYGEQATRIVFPPASAVASVLQVEIETPPKLPKSPEQIRSLLVKISEAVSASVSNDSW
jgi:hypothetical protein